ncbi:DnaT-like ssDNA-binding domain-containing protein [Congregibacter variabilis]|uniref:DnaT-like ssDNA-binding domain-containing protein n=1 Tax=Congregibacter variabilis TaxID=3081200 RepID=A0ABZ0I1X1_9GAMM|nr:DnaT-like ssDNA-binding domain-containing protein [Congregibacter sp. IMCC43200]
MAPKPLIPDSQLLFSAELATAVGLAEAVLLQQIKGLYLHQPSTRREGLAWLHISRAYLLQLLPFWSAAELQTVCDSLESLGLIVIDRKIAAQDSLLLAINETPIEETTTTVQAPTMVSPSVAAIAKAIPDQASTAKVPAAVPKPPAPRPGKREGQPLPPDFQPSEDMLELLERFHGVPRGFALQQIEDFTLYWRERGSAGHAWQNRFKQHVQFQWARQQQEATGVDHAGQRGTGTTRRTRDSSLESDLTDTSWAE